MCRTDFTNIFEVQDSLGRLRGVLGFTRLILCLHSPMVSLKLETNLSPLKMQCLSNVVWIYLISLAREESLWDRLGLFISFKISIKLSEKLERESVLRGCSAAAGGAGVLPGGKDWNQGPVHGITWGHLPKPGLFFYNYGNSEVTCPFLFFSIFPPIFPFFYSSLPFFLISPLNYYLL